jgi:LDH2 family malate/lactate/ureidoglycolate dehydrogenase
MPEGLRYDAAALQDFVRRCLLAAGARGADAIAVADVLVAADLRGVASHGVARLRRYVEGLRSGGINAHPNTSTISESAATILIDADHGLGQPVSIAAMQAAIAKGRENGVGVAIVANSNHFGIAGFYTSLALDHGMIGVASTNASPQVCPTSGAEAMFGTNPIAVAVPGPGGDDFELDMATSVVPRGKIEKMSWTGEAIPEGWAVDPEGLPARSHDALVSGLKQREGYALLPLGGAGELHGGHKGFGLGLLVDILCGPLAGAGWGRHTYAGGRARLGHFFLALDVSAVRPLAAVRSDLAAMFEELRGSRRARGAARIRVAGERRRELESRNRADGIAVDAAVVEELRAVSRIVNVELPTTSSTGRP